MRAFVLALAAILIGGACASAPGYFGRDYIPTALTARRQQYQGFSVQPPASLPWHLRVSEQTPYVAIYRRELSGSTHTLIAGVQLIQLEKGVAFEEAAAPHGFKDPARYTLIETSHETDPSRETPCIRYSLHLIDKGAPSASQQGLHLLEKGFVCAQPALPGVAVRASFSERGLVEELDATLWDELEPFLKGVQIESAPGGPDA